MFYSSTKAFNQSCVWYVKSESNGKDVKEGSAVAIRLKNKAKGNSKVYLLTCGHVVRQGVRGEGRFQDIIVAWQPGHEFNEAISGVRVNVYSNIKPYKGVGLDQNNSDSTNIENDWVVLCFDLEPKCRVVDQWGRAEVNSFVDVLGYPLGKRSFENVVQPTISDRISVHSVANTPGKSRSLVLTSDDARPGMSGGGVFDYETLSLVGLHRARNEGLMQLKSVPMSHIANIMDEQGYHIVTDCNQTVMTIVLIVSVCFLVIMAALLLI